MYTEEHYLALRQHLPEIREQQAVEVSLEEIADWLCCTPRNARLLLKKMTEQRLLHWTPGRGRGNRSTLVFEVSLREVVVQSAERWVQKGDLGTALARMKQSLADGAIPKELFSEWLARHLGYQEEGSAAKQRDVLRFPMRPMALQFDPALLSTWHESRFVRQVFDTLVSFEEKTEAFTPRLAYHWEANETATVWTFRLRKGVRFHHGRVLTAHDVAYTLRRLSEGAVSERFRWMFGSIREIRVLKETVVQIELDKPNHAFLHYVSMEQAGIVPEDVCEERGTAFTERPVGTGPFAMVRHDESMIALEAHDLYFLGRPHLDRIEVWLVPRPTDLGLVQNLGGHEVPYVPYLVEGEQPNWGEMQRVDESISYLLFNMKKPGPHHDPRIREALSLAIDRGRMVEELGQVRYRAASGLLLDGEATPAAFDLTRARALVAEVTGGELVHLQLYTFQSFTNLQDPDWLQARCREAGIELEVQVLPFLEYKQRHQEADVILSAWVYDVNVEVSLSDLLLSSLSDYQKSLPAEVARWVTASLNRVQENPSRSERKAMIAGIDRVLSEQFFVLYLYTTYQETRFHPSLQGIVEDEFGWDHFRTLWFRES
jgi:MarR-like DNA-binding transcriptional regulator SgrR of sgrS sRNA